MAWAWAAHHTDVIFLNYNEFLGCERIEAKADDPEPVPGNRWDLIPEYIVDDGYGVHLNRAGCAAAWATGFRGHIIVLYRFQVALPRGQ